ncbi:hypothetical protein FOA52_009408 [Chlamydomonas sp. UWO 241]|nr:hypothetical protein FOA52_009408 [Chlamydomonas sp. UWO 241]
MAVACESRYSFVILCFYVSLSPRVLFSFLPVVPSSVPSSTCLEVSWLPFPRVRVPHPFTCLILESVLQTKFL